MFWYLKYYCCLKILLDTPMFCFMTSFQLWLLCKSCPGNQIARSTKYIQRSFMCTKYQSSIWMRSWDSTICIWLLGWLLWKQILHFGLLCASVWCSHTQNIIVVWNFAWNSFFLLVHLCALVVAKEKLSWSTKLQDLKSGFVDLAYEPNFTALSQKEAKI